MHRTALFLSALAACGDNLRSYDLYEAEPTEFRTATFWVQPHPELPGELVREACEAWRPEGVRCAQVGDPHEALVRIRASEAECVEDADGNYALGRAWVGGEIVLMIACLRKFGGEPIAEEILWPTIAHEVGHQLGIWHHVPTDCDDPEVMTHPEAGPVCGAALMNPMINRGLYGITLHDHHAYALRDADLSVLRLDPRAGCTFTASD